MFVQQIQRLTVLSTHKLFAIFRCGLYFIIFYQIRKKLHIFVIKVEKLVTDNTLQVSALGYSLQDYNRGLDHPSKRNKIRYYINNRQPETAAKQPKKLACASALGRPDLFPTSSSKSAAS